MFLDDTEEWTYASIQSRIWSWRLGSIKSDVPRCRYSSCADADALSNYRELAPGMPYAHPTVEHLIPLFITLGAATTADAAPQTLIDGYFMGLSKRSILVA